MFEIVFESVQQKHQDKIILDQQVVNLSEEKKQVSQTCTIAIYSLRDIEVTH